MNISRFFASVTAVTAWAALALQLYLIVEKMTSEGAAPLEALWRFFGFFTILTNIAVAIAAAVMVFKDLGAVTRLALVSAIAFVGIVYSAALRATWQPTGWQAAADHLLHDATPLLFAAVWLTSQHGGLRWRDALWAIAAPLTYCLYAWIRGSGDGWYAYWFLDPTKLDGARMTASIAILSASFIALALAFIALDKKLAARNSS